MAGKIKRLVEVIIEKRAQGNEVAVAFTRAKLILKGIDPGKYTALSPDDPVILRKLETLARELGLSL